MAGDGELASSKVEISIPIFLRAHIQDILSIGKSIKIIRYIEKVNMHKANLVTLNQLNEEFYVNYKRLVMQNVHRLARDSEEQASAISTVQGITD